jgi:hypothetical protein
MNRPLILLSGFAPHQELACWNRDQIGFKEWYPDIETRPLGSHA